MRADTLWLDHFVFKNETLSNDRKWALINSYVSQNLSIYQWIQNPSVILTDVQRDLWDTYFEQLHDSRTIYPNPDDVIFPDPPPLPNNPVTPAEVTKRAIRRNAKNVASQSLNTNSLVGRNISTINNNADRDALLQAICYLIGITDGNGVILATPVTQTSTTINKVNKNS